MADHAGRPAGGGASVLSLPHHWCCFATAPREAERGAVALIVNLLAHPRDGERLHNEVALPRLNDNLGSPPLVGT